MSARGDPGGDPPAVALVSMPFAGLVRPSLALGLLQGVLRRDGFPCRSFYLNLDFAEELGTRLYHLVCHLGPTGCQAGDWAFAEAAFGDQAPPADLYLDCLPRAWGGLRETPRARAVLRDLRFIRGTAQAFVERAARQVLAWRPRIVGCTTSLDQTVASLALLREVRRQDPEVRTMLGGSNCETRMGMALHRNFPWIDYLVSGEADGLLPGLCRAIGRHGTAIPTSDLPAGVLGPQHRHAGYPPELARALERDLDALPDPDFDDYFQRLHASPLARVVAPALPVEASRGCWWGARRPCTFCGLNGSSMAYRSRRPEALLEALDRQVCRYGPRRVFLVDNILDHGYLRSLVPALAKRSDPLRLFCEVRANLRPDQLRALKKAGAVWLQMGIESFHPQHLRLMDKGVQVWQNVCALRQARESGLWVSWLLLWGFPGEQDDWFTEMARLLPWIEHLQPPLFFLRIRFDRYSVYQTRAREFGLHLEPIGAVGRIYPLPEEELADLAYAFLDREDPDVFRVAPTPGRGLRSPDERPGVRDLARVVARWRRVHAAGLPPLLHVEEDGEALRFLDSRRVATEPAFLLEGAERDLYLACEASPLRRGLAVRAGLEAESAEKALLALRRRGVVLELDGRVVPLALRGSVPSLPGRRDYPGGHLLGDLPPSGQTPVARG
jgi:ribosomal peptide maturation radical SAM protein 1